MGNQGHNKGDKKSGGRFKNVSLEPASPPTVATPITETIKKATPKKNMARNKPIDYATWDPPANLETIAKELWESTGGFNNYNHFENYTRTLAKRILPDLSEATGDEMLILRKRLMEIARLDGGYRFSEFENIVRVENIMRGQSNLGEDGISDTKSAVERLEESIRDQGATYSAQELFRIRLEGVQEDLADPTSWNVTVKVPSGYEITVSKPDARAILASMKIRPAATKPYLPLWPVKNELIR